MSSVTLTTLLARVRERADMVGSSFVADSANGLYAWINEAHQKLHGMLVDAMGEEYISSTATLTTVVSQSDYSLSALTGGFYKLYGVGLPYQGDMRSLERYVRAERNVFRNRQPGGNYEIPRYSLIGSNIRLYPAPSTVMAGEILYAPEATVLTAGSDTVNYPNGWEAFIVLDAAIQCLAKEESDTRTLAAERAAIVRQIELAKESRDLATPMRVVDTSNLDYFPEW